MVDKRGGWNVGQAFDLDKASDLLDDRMVKNMASDLRRQLGADALKPHKPLITGPGAGPGGIPISSGRRGMHNKVGGAQGSLHGATRDLAGAAIHNRSPAGRSGSKDGDLMSTMMQRLGKLEAMNLALKSELKEKNSTIMHLEDTNSKLRLAASDESIEEIAKLVVERDQYKLQTEEMTKFLSDYGLKWVGDEGQQNQGKFDAQAITEELKFQPPQYRSNVPAEIDTEVLQKRIEELNFIAEKQRMVTMAGNGGKMKGFKILDDVPIFFFANGLMIKGFPFYPYYSKQAQSVLSDILDGYFPYDLKTKYPEGVPLKPIDLVDETYNNQFKQDPRFKQLADLDGLNAMSKQEFLNQFPKQIVKDGNIIPIREELEKKFKETNKIDTNKLNSHEPIEIETHVSGDTDPSTVVSLRVRTETGKRNVIVKMLTTDTIAAVYDYVKNYIEGNDATVFELRTNFPNKAYQKEDPKTLKELGLAPSSALIIRAL